MVIEVLGIIYYVVYSVKYHKMNANLLLSGGWDRRVVLWDIRMKKPEAN